VIRSFNEEQHIGRLLSGIAQQTITDVEIILVDSGSTDATVAIASKFPVRVLHISPEEFSFGRSLNLGCRAATREFIVLASAHVYPLYDDWLEKLLQPFEAHNVCLSYGKQRGGPTTKYSEHQVFAQWFRDESVPRQNHPFCNNANAAIRRDTWEAMPYDEQLTGLEDLAWASQALRDGRDISYVASAEVAHIHDETPLNVYNRYRREAMAYKSIFPDDRFALRDCVKLATANIASDYYHAWHDGVLKENLVSIPVFRGCQFFGAYRGQTRREPMTNQLKKTFYYPRRFTRTAPDDRSTAERRVIDYSKPR
jgi:rhamnosyltransferase